MHHTKRRYIYFSIHQLELSDKREMCEDETFSSCKAIDAVYRNREVCLTYCTVISTGLGARCNRVRILWSYAREAARSCLNFPRALAC